MNIIMLEGVSEVGAKYDEGKGGVAECSEGCWKWFAVLAHTVSQDWFFFRPSFSPLLRLIFRFGRATIFAHMRFFLLYNLIMLTDRVFSLLCCC